jgi:transcription initiation factor IIE alpha subunit
MLIVRRIADRFNRHHDLRIVGCLQQCGTMTETALHSKTSINLSKLRKRLASLADKKLVTGQLTSEMEPIWSIHHPRMAQR